MNQLDVVIGIDMETDVGSWSSSYEGLREGTPRLLDILSRRSVKATFFWTGHAARTHTEMVRELAKAGHEVGAHGMYHETLGDEIFPIPGIQPLLAQEVPIRIRRATEEVENACGARPVSFRCPRLFGSTAVVNALEGLGYVADATYPMYRFRERLRPYHPSRDDWTKEGTLRIVEIPNFADLSMGSKDEYGRDMDQWPLFRTESAAALMEHVDGYCAYCRDRSVTPLLCFYFHPWEFHEMPQGEIRVGEGWVRPDPFIVENCGRYATEQFDRLLEALAQRGARFMQAREIAGGK